MARPTLRSWQAHNWRTLRAAPLAEISGALGDLGTLLPLIIALTRTSSISLSSTLVFGGLANVVTGLVFGIPLPVQPMKAIAAVALSRSLSRAETASAGLFVAGVVFLFSLTGLLRWFTRVIPVPVVKGIQIGAGLSLILSAGTSLLQPLGWTEPSWSDNLLWALFAAALLLLTARLPRFPYALFIFVLGISFAFARLSSSHLHFPHFERWHPTTILPSPKDFRHGTIYAGLGQVPLTTLNSIIAVSHLSSDLLPDLPAPTTTALGFSVAAMNLSGCWFGAMPVCHGSGGLAAQFRFGARSGSSVIILGLFKLVLGLVLGDSLVGLFQRFPEALLGIMVLAAGLELARVGESLNQGARDLWEAGSGAEDDPQRHDSAKRSRVPDAEERSRRWSVMLMTVAGLLAFRNDAVGFIAGMCCHWSFTLSDRSWGLPRWPQWMSRRSDELERQGLLS
ncbi:MAG: hypothetical protein M1838_006225 [Thelocarpon superellum]|nr:MAG: hypothetical protein M1838_006225 [Thelocarpon superellum]